jgi:hypothetical protein
MRLISGHLAEAFILAGVMILSVEGLTRYMAGREQIKDTQRVSQQFHMQANRVSANVWNAIFARLVPEQIATEIKRILKSDVCRIRPQYTVILTREPYENVPAGYIVVRRQLYYRLLNLTGGEVIYPITIKVLSHTGSFNIVAKSGSRLSLPRICELKIQGSAVSLGKDICTTTTHSLLLPKMDKESEAWEVYSEVEELCRVSDRNSYVLTAPCYGLELQVINQLEDEIETPTDTVYLTSGADPLRMTTPGKWVTESGLLSGTTLSLSWKARAENVNNA